MADFNEMPVKERSGRMETVTSLESRLFDLRVSGRHGTEEYRRLQERVWSISCDRVVPNDRY